jgi:hypothetical protein
MTQVYRLHGGFSGGEVPDVRMSVSWHDREGVQRVFVRADEVLSLVFGEENGEIIRCVEDGMDKLVGRNARLGIFYHIEAGFGLSENQIPYNPLKFVLALRRIFGIGTKLIVASIFEQMRSLGRGDAQFLRFAEAMELAANEPSQIPEI